MNLLLSPPLVRDVFLFLSKWAAKVIAGFLYVQGALQKNQKKFLHGLSRCWAHFSSELKRYFVKKTLR